MRKMSESQKLVSDGDMKSYSSANSTNTSKNQKSQGFRHYGEEVFSYKAPNYMSTSAFQTIAEEIERQKEHTRLSRSASVGVDMMPSSLNPVLTGGRRALYGTLPFVAAFGMQHRETTVRRVLSAASCNALRELEDVRT